MKDAHSTKAILYAFVANLGIAAAKTGAAVWTGSGSLLAEAIHSFADCGNQVLLLIGMKRSEKSPTAPRKKTAFTRRWSNGMLTAGLSGAPNSNWLS